MDSHEDSRATPPKHMVLGDAVCPEVSYCLLHADPKAWQGWRVQLGVEASTTLRSCFPNVSPSSGSAVFSEKGTKEQRSRGRGQEAKRGPCASEDARQQCQVSLNILDLLCLVCAFVHLISVYPTVTHTGHTDDQTWTQS